MPARNALLDLSRPPLSSLVVQVRGHGLLFTLAITEFTIVLFFLLDTVDANADKKTLPRRGVESEQEVLQDRRLAKRVLSSPMPKYESDYYITIRKSSVRCVYFTDWPPHTYCLVRNGMYFNTFDDADSYCNSIFLRLLSMTSAPMYRICRLLRLFGIKDRRLWVKNTLHQPSTLGWEDCYFRAENKPKPPMNCDSCNISVICVDDSIYSDVSQCETLNVQVISKFRVTRTKGDNDVEYCYENDKVDATEVSEQCTKHSSVLVDTQRIDRGVWSDIRGLFYLDLEESWVDLIQNDLSHLSGVISRNFAEIDWRSPCTTVLLNGVVPWFFVRNCSDSYPVVCETRGASKDDILNNYSKYYDTDIQDCGDNNSAFCFSGGRRFNKTTATRFCANYTYSVLNGKTLRTLFFAYRQFSTSNENRPIVWDTHAVSNRQNNSSTCYAANLETGAELIEYDCSEKLGYFCSKLKPRSTNDFDCEYANAARWSRRPVCVSNVGINLGESITQCTKLGMDLLPAGLDHKEYAVIVKNYFLLFMVPRPHLALWLDTPQSCAVMSDWKNFSFQSVQCDKSVASTLCMCWCDCWLMIECRIPSGHTFAQPFRASCISEKCSWT